MPTWHDSATSRGRGVTQIMNLLLLAPDIRRRYWIVAASVDSFPLAERQVRSITKIVMERRNTAPMRIAMAALSRIPLSVFKSGTAKSFSACSAVEPMTQAQSAAFGALRPRDACCQPGCHQAIIRSFESQIAGWQKGRR